MAVSQELLDILACPKCKGDLRVTDKQDGLICDACRLRLPDQGRHSDHADRRSAGGEMTLLDGQALKH